VPATAIPAGATAITPDMLTLISLTQAEIDAVVAAVPGGAANVQDIYPLAPLQEGVLFHHLMASEGDPYLLTIGMSLDSRERLQDYLSAFQSVVDRHDILRTAVMWEGLPERVQVVWRRARLVVEEVTLNPADGDALTQLRTRFDPRRHRIDVRHAPMLRMYTAHDADRDRWVLLTLGHHLMDDNTTFRFIFTEIQAFLGGRGDTLPEPLPFRTFVAQGRQAVDAAADAKFFTAMLGDIDEPTAPFGLLSTGGDGRRVVEGRLTLEPELARRLRERVRQLGVSAASVCHLAWAQVLSRLTGRSDVVFGTVLFGRMQGGEGADRAMGPFINTLPLRLTVDDTRIEAAVRRTHSLLADLLRHEHASLALAQRCSAVRAPAPLFTSLLNYRHIVRAVELSPGSEMDWDGIKWEH
jgi:Condensation domain